MAPARILLREPEHQLPNLSRQARPSALGRAPVAASDERAFDASAEASAESLDASHAMSAAGGTLLPPAAPDQPSGASVARPAGAGSQARGAAPAARRPSRAGPDGYAQARRAEPARRDRGTRRPYPRSSQLPHRRAMTPILAPFRAKSSGSTAFSSADKVGSNWKNWNTTPTCSPRQTASSSSLIESIRRPSTVTVPALGPS